MPLSLILTICILFVIPLSEFPTFGGLLQFSRQEIFYRQLGMLIVSLFLSYCHAGGVNELFEVTFISKLLHLFHGHQINYSTESKKRTGVTNI